MRVLLVNKYNYLKGGSEKYFLELAELLERQGHEVAKFAMQNEFNLTDRNEKYFVSQVDFNGGTVWNKLRAACRIFWSFEAKEKFTALVEDFEPEVIHIHNIYHQLSPSILRVASEKKIPVVMHLHDYKLLCPNMKMYNAQGICERCKGGKYLNCATNKCVKDSFLKSLLASLEMYWHHQILKIYERTISIYVAPSEFVANKAREWGVPADKIIVQPYFIKTDDYTPNFEPGDYLLYYGRLATEKGIETLLQAYKQLGEKVSSLKIVGAGPDYQKIEQLVNELGLTHRVMLTGPKYGETLKQIVAQSYAVIVPSEWYEVTGIVNLEASILGKPLVVANIGGIPEVVRNRETGLLFKSGNVVALREALKLLLSDEVLARQFGEAGREYVLANFGQKMHLENILTIYKKALKLNK